MRRCVRCRIVALAAAVLALPSTAWPLTDPTRPPAAMERAPHGENAASTGGPVLQSIMLGRGRSEAVISGQRVKLGGTYEDARVVKITETEVVLRREQGVETLKLFPGVEKQVTKPRTAIQAGKPAREK